MIDYTTAITGDKSNPEVNQKYSQNWLGEIQTKWWWSLFNHREVQLHVMRDGIIVLTRSFSKFLPKPVFTEQAESYDWARVTSVDVRADPIRVVVEGEHKTIEGMSDGAQRSGFFNRLTDARLQGDIPPHVVFAGHEKAPTQEKKKSRSSTVLGWVVLISVAAVGYNWLRDGEETLCAGRNHYVVAQIPYALDILSVRHPLTVGLVRKSLNDNGTMDRFVQAALLAAAPQNDGEDAASCALQSFVLRVSPDAMRKKIADQFEVTFKLKELP